MSKFLLILADITFVCVIVVLGLERCMHIGNIVLTKYYIVSIYNIPTNTVTFEIRQTIFTIVDESSALLCLHSNKYIELKIRYTDII